MRLIGEITSGKEGCFKWNIERFREEWEKYLSWCSSYFTYKSRTCNLSLRKESESTIEIAFCIYNSPLPNRQYVELQLSTECNIVLGLYGNTLTSSNRRACVSILFKEFLSLGSPLHDRLTVLLRVRELKSCNVLPDEFWSDKASVKKTSDEEETNSKTFKKMLKDFKSLLVSGEDSDVTLVVSGKIFPAHRTILCARSAVFKAMLCHDTSERDSGIVNIDDCHPDRFQDFLNYVYTGSTRHIDTENVTSLYTTSDKYLMGELKETCVSFMKTNISVEWFCGIAILALRHEEKELLHSLTHFFCENGKQIIDTENWVTFMKDYPNDAYEHFMKPSISRR